MLQVARWLPDRQIVSVTDSGFAAIELLNAVRHRICMIIRLGLDARRPRVVGRRQPLLVQRLANSRTCWRRITRPPGAESAICWFTTLPMSSSHRLFCALISMPTRSTSFAGSSAVGQSRSLAEVRRHPGVETQRDGLLHSINAGEARSLGTVRSTRPADAAPLLKLVKEARRSTPAALISSAIGIQPVQRPGEAYYLTIEGGIDAPPSVIFNERPFRDHDPSGRQGGFGACQSLPSRAAAHASRVAPEE